LTREDLEEEAPKMEVKAMGLIHPRDGSASRVKFILLVSSQSTVITFITHLQGDRPKPLVVCDSTCEDEEDEKIKEELAPLVEKAILRGEVLPKMASLLNTCGKDRYLVV
jgi:hypothetical protein